MVQDDAPLVVRLGQIEGARVRHAVPDATRLVAHDLEVAEVVSAPVQGQLGEVDAVVHPAGRQADARVLHLDLQYGIPGDDLRCDALRLLVVYDHEAPGADLGGYLAPELRQVSPQLGHLVRRGHHHRPQLGLGLTCISGRANSVCHCRTSSVGFGQAPGCSTTAGAIVLLVYDRSQIDYGRQQLIRPDHRVRS